MGYFGSKSQAGVFQRIISQMPPHSFYVEPFFGSGQIFRRKLLSAVSVLIDADAGVLAEFGVDCRRRTAEMTLLADNGGTAARIRAIAWDALCELVALKPTMPHDAVIYCDPPYLLSTRTSLHRYKFEMTDEQHAALLAILQEMPARVLISGYPSPLYAQALKKWRCISYRTRTRGRTVTECLWCNFPEPTELHDWRFIGDDYRERLNLKRFAARFLARLDGMPELKRNFILSLVHQRHF